MSTLLLKLTKTGKLQIPILDSISTTPVPFDYSSARKAFQYLRIIYIAITPETRDIDLFFCRW